MGLNRTFRIVTGVQIPRQEFDDRFGDTYEFEHMDNSLLAFDGWEQKQETVVVGKVIAEFNKHGDLEAMHSQDLMKEHSLARGTVESELEEIGIERGVSIYTVAEVR